MFDEWDNNNSIMSKPIDLLTGEVAFNRVTHLVRCPLYRTTVIKNLGQNMVAGIVNDIKGGRIVIKQHGINELE